jgi:hypothetical protein
MVSLRFQRSTSAPAIGLNEGELSHARAENRNKLPCPNDEKAAHPRWTIIFHKTSLNKCAINYCRYTGLLQITFVILYGSGLHLFKIFTYSVYPS